MKTWFCTSPKNHPNPIMQNYNAETEISLYSEYTCSQTYKQWLPCRLMSVSWALTGVIERIQNQKIIHLMWLNRKRYPIFLKKSEKNATIIMIRRNNTIIFCFWMLLYPAPELKSQKNKVGLYTTRSRNAF